MAQSTKAANKAASAAQPPPAVASSAKAVLAMSIQCPDGARRWMPARTFDVLYHARLQTPPLSPSHPAASNVDTALGHLAALGAITSADDASAVTPFGRMLASFPGDLSLGKLVAVGAVVSGLILPISSLKGGRFLARAFLVPAAWSRCRCGCSSCCTLGRRRLPHAARSCRVVTR